MITTLRNAWKQFDLRKKLLFTLLIVVLFRIGSVIPIPFINTTALQSVMSSYTSSIYGLFNLMSGGAYSMATFFALGVQPYINASIIIQLLTVAIPSLERIAKEEGEMGKKKMKRITFVSAIAIGLIQALGYYFMIRNYGLLIENTTIWHAIIIIAIITGGATLLTWLGELIDDKGIGNGISIILFAGIISRLPNMTASFASQISGWFSQKTGIAPWIAAGILIGAIILFLLVIIFNDAEKRIPVFYAKRQVGNKLYGGSSSHIPIKTNMTGVLPIIFAQSVLTLPVNIFNFTGNPTKGFGLFIYNSISNQDVLYIVLYAALIIAFSYFYASMQYNPIEISNQLRQNGGTVPGFRPGRPTSTLLTNTIRGIILVSAIYLMIVAILPIIAGKVANNSSIMLGGTSLIIIVGVALEMYNSLKAETSLYNYSSIFGKI